MIPDKIIKALEYCSEQGITSECEGCKFKKGCRPELIANALYLIRRQKGNIKELANGHKTLQKTIAEKNAEIERLQTENKLLIKNSPSTKYPNCVLVGDALVYTKTLEDYDKLLHDISAEAIKEFAERLIAVSHPYADTQIVFELQIDNLVKEMMEKGD